MTPFFSIIIPTYNRANSCLKAIKSVFDQSFSEWELIIIDDGSTDNTKELISEYINKDNRIIYVFQENQERSISRNNGIKLAKGKYICFLDSDDLYTKYHLRNFFDKIKFEKFPKAMLICNVSRLYKNEIQKVKFESYKTHNNAVEFILKSKESIIPARVCINREILEKKMFNPSLNISEDAELFVRILAKYDLFQINKYGCIYSLHDDNTTHLKNNPFKGQLKSLKIIFNNPDLKKLISKKVKREKLSACYFGISRYHLINRNLLIMRYYLLKSIFLFPTSKSTKHKFYLFIFGK